MLSSHHPPVDYAPTTANAEFRSGLTKDIDDETKTVYPPGHYHPPAWGLCRLPHIWCEVDLFSYTGAKEDLRDLPA